MKTFKYVRMNREFTPDRRGFLSGLQQNLKVIFTSVKTENRGI